jgi:glycosyltransferase involved in cell wall biosynthesis
MRVSGHILLYTDDPDAGGVAQYNHAVLSALARRGYRVTCVQSPADNPLIRRQADLGVRHAWLDFNTGKDLQRALTNTADAARIFDEARPDLVAFSNCCPVSNLAAKRAAVEHRLRFVIVEGFVAPYLAQMFSSILGELSQQYARAQAVVAVSGENLDWLHRAFGLPPDKGQVIHYGRPACYFDPPNPATRQRLRESVCVPADGVLCFTAGRLEQIKGYQYQLAAIRMLQAGPVWPRLYFAWAGPGNLEAQLAETIMQMGVGAQVKLLGQRWDVADWLDAADIFVLPSEAEGMPLAVMEAMAKGLPVIASAVSGIPEELGETGKLLPPPRIDPQGTVRELAATIETWTCDAALRQSLGTGCQERARAMFREERMIDETLQVIERALLPPGDYVSPGLRIIRPDACFPHLAVGDPQTNAWPYLRRHIPHNWYVDRRCPAIGFLSRDEAHLLYNNALQFRGRRVLEIGCFLGWSSCHLALAGVELDVIDPLLARPHFLESVTGSLEAAGVRRSVHLHAGSSPELVQELATRLERRWALVFIDGDHEAPHPLRDAMACAPFVEADAMFLFHDLAAPDVAEGLHCFRGQGWQTVIYHTMQVMGVAWRGQVQPVVHQPDPRIRWVVPEHLGHYRASAEAPAGQS